MMLAYWNNKNASSHVCITLILQTRMKWSLKTKQTNKEHFGLFMNAGKLTNGNNQALNYCASS